MAPRNVRRTSGFRLSLLLTTVARQLDALAMIDGLKGVMCIFDDFVVGTEDFGRHVMPLRRCR